MPVYEYICHDCGRLETVLVRSFTAEVKPVCPACKGSNLRRKLSRVVVVKGARKQLEEFDRSRLVGEYEGRDKGSQARWARRVSRELGDELGSEFRDMAEKVEGGEDVWDLVDPAPTLDYKLEQKSQEAAKAEGGASEAPAP